MSNPKTPVAPQAEAETARLYRQYEPQILRYCRRHLRSREDAEDAAQTTFLRAFGALRRGFEPEFEAAWLYKIAHNVCVSKALSRQRRARLESPTDLQAEERLAAPQPNADELFELGDVLEDMPERLRTAILLREWQGLSYAEIADKLGTSRSAVETLIFRGRRYLAQALDDSTAKLRQLITLGPVAGLVRDLFVRLGAAKVAAGAALSATALVGGGVVAHDIISRSSKPTTTIQRSTLPDSSRAPAGSARSGRAQPTAGGRPGTASAPRGSSSSHPTDVLHAQLPGGSKPGATRGGSQAPQPAVHSTPELQGVPKTPKTPSASMPSEPSHAAPTPSLPGIPATPSVQTPTTPTLPSLPPLSEPSLPTAPPAPSTPTLP